MLSDIVVWVRCVGFQGSTLHVGCYSCCLQGFYQSLSNAVDAFVDFIEAFYWHLNGLFKGGLQWALQWVCMFIVRLGSSSYHSLRVALTHRSWGFVWLLWG